GSKGLPLLIVPNPMNPDSAPSSPQSPIPNPAAPAWWTYRDREEELIAVARQVKADEAAGKAVNLTRTAVVFKQPLPYLYAAAEVFRSARIPFQASDAMPLAAEPTAAALDLVLDAVASDFTRGTLVALLRSPHFVFTDGGAEMSRESISTLDRMLSEARYLGDPERLQGLASEGSADGLRDEDAADAGPPVAPDRDGPRGRRAGSRIAGSVAQPCRAALSAALALARQLAPLATP